MFKTVRNRKPAFRPSRRQELAVCCDSGCQLRLCETHALARLSHPCRQLERLIREPIAATMFFTVSSRVFDACPTTPFRHRLLLGHASPRCTVPSPCTRIRSHCAPVAAISGYDQQNDLAPCSFAESGNRSRSKRDSDTTVHASASQARNERSSCSRSASVKLPIRLITSRSSIVKRPRFTAEGTFSPAPAQSVRMNSPDSSPLVRLVNGTTKRSR